MLYAMVPLEVFSHLKHLFGVAEVGKQVSPRGKDVQMQFCNAICYDPT